jgi:NAD(P)-dependent dehydrogenase (short-subunit alcohol dehydrogenase family)
LLNAAGGNMPGATIAPDGTFFDLKPDQFQRVLDLNLTGTVIPTQQFLKPMVKQGEGVIVNFSSMAAFRPMTRVCGYAAAKAGISNFTKFLATEVATKFTEKIRVNAIAPGFFLTEQNRTLLTNADGSFTQRGKDVIRQTPFGRFGQPEELCGTIHYLISDASKFVTGTVAVVDGGFECFAM